MAMAAAERLLVDTNILLEATDERRSHHQEARTFVESHRGLVFPAQVVREYLVVATRPTSSNGLGLSLDHALANVAEFRRVIRLLGESRPLLPTLLRLLAAVPCRGTQIHDAHIVASAVVHRVKTIVSLNIDDFARFSPRVTAVTPRRVKDRLNE
jgi:predicted nucleic acid-binding protein